MKKKRDRTQEHLDQLREVRGRGAEGVPVLQAALGSTSNYVVAKAAEIAEQERLSELAPQLLDAFERFIADAPRIDQGCAATTAIIKALYALDYQEPGPYKRGVRHRQLEGWGTPTDVASELRGACALGLAQTRDDRVLDELVLLLTDSEAPARLSAARAIGCRDDLAGIPVLMLKVHMSDEDPGVLAECLASILAIALNGRTLQFVIEQLDSTDAELSEAAALALGSVRDDRAFDALRAKWDSTAHGPMRERLLHAMSVSRMEKAIEFLTGLIANEPLRTASLAVKYLAIHRRDSRIQERALRLAEQRPELASVIRAAFNRSTLE